MGGLGVEDHVGCGYPETGQLAQYINHFVGLKIVDEYVWKPEVLDELEVHWYHDVRIIGVVDSRTGLFSSKFRIQVEPFLRPLDVEVAREGDGVILVVDSEHLVDVDGHEDVVDALFHRQLKF